MNPVLAGMALVLLVVFAALAGSRKRKEQQNWQVLAGLAAVFAVALAASVFIPPFESAPPADTTAPPGTSGPVVVELEGVLRMPVSACGSEFCFGIDVLRVTEGPKELADEKNLQIRTDKSVLLAGDLILEVSGTLQEGYVQVPHIKIVSIDSEGNKYIVGFVEPGATPQEEAPVEVSFTGNPLGNWEVCGSKWCNKLQTFDYSGENGEPPAEFMVESDANPGVAAEYAVSGTLSGDWVSATAIGPALAVGEE